MGAIKQNIPNFITCLNLLFGCIGIEFVLEHHPYWAVNCMLIAAGFDFLDGLVARLLKVTSPIGKDLDSLADVVTFGVLPALMMFMLLRNALIDDYFIPRDSTPRKMLWFKYIALLIPIFSAIRLARFNNDTSQSYGFRGLPTPANGLLLASIFYWVHLKSLLYRPSPLWSVKTENDPLWKRPDSLFEEKMLEIFSNPWVIIGLIGICCFLLVSNIRLMAFKFKNFSWKENQWKYILLILCLPLVIFLKFASAPIILILYIIISQIHFRTHKNEI